MSWILVIVGPILCVAVFAYCAAVGVGRRHDMQAVLDQEAKGAAIAAKATLLAQSKAHAQEVARLKAKLVATRKESAGLSKPLKPIEAAYRAAQEKAATAQKAVDALIASDARLTANAEGLIAQQRDALQAMQKEINQHEQKTRDELARKTQAQEDLKQLNARANTLKQSLVAVYDAQRHLSTGVIVAYQSGATYVLTAAVRGQGSLECMLRNGNTFAKAKASVVLRDKKIGLQLLACRAAPYASSPVLNIREDLGAPIDKGASLLGVGTDLEQNGYADRVFDGTVSALDREAGGQRFLQTTLPITSGSMGSPVLSAQGRVIGFLIGAAPDLERTSLLLQLKEMSAFLPRMDAEIARAAGSGVLNYKPPFNDIGKQESIAQAKTRPLPYAMENAISLEKPLSPQAMLLAGPDDTVLSWDPTTLELAAYKGGVRPLWKQALKGDCAVAYERFNDTLMVAGNMTVQPSVEINVRTGRPSAQIPIIKLYGKGQIVKPWAFQKLGNYRLLVQQNELALVNAQTARGLSFVRGWQLLGKNEDTIAFSCAEGLGWFSQSRLLQIVARITQVLEDLERRLIAQQQLAPPDPRWIDAQVAGAIRQIEALTQEAQGSATIVKIGDVRRQTSNLAQSFSHIPGTYRCMIDLTLWEIGPKDVDRKGELIPLRHRAGDQPWFHAYYNHDPSLSAVTSPDGRYAMTDTHLYELSEFMHVAELPFPAAAYGFTSSGQMIYAYDRCFNRIVFLKVNNLLQNESADR